jgi:GntR family transcriptional regulator of vanillate catabolism
VLFRSQRGRELLAKGHLVPTDVAAWGALNRDFHAALVGAAGSPVIADAIARNNHLPFASADSITLDTGALDREFTKLSLAQVHHELVLDAIRQREGARVEALMREHAWIGVRYGALL